MCSQSNVEHGCCDEKRDVVGLCTDCMHIRPYLVEDRIAGDAICTYYHAINLPPSHQEGSWQNPGSRLQELHPSLIPMQ